MGSGSYSSTYHTKQPQKLTKMKNYFSYCLVLLIICFTSCNFTEELTLNENGSGRLTVKFDGSELLQMGGKTNPEEEANGKVLDSFISFKELLENKKDSIALLTPEEQKRLKKLEPFNLHLVMDENKGDMKIDIYTDFKKISEVSDGFSAFQNIGAFGNTGLNVQSDKSSFSMAEATEMKYTFKGSEFTRTNTIVDFDLLQQNVDSLGQMGLFLESSMYKLIYHFPRPVKSVSKKGALFSEDRKTIIIEVPFMDYMRDPEILNIEVILAK